MSLPVDEHGNFIVDGARYVADAAPVEGITPTRLGVPTGVVEIGDTTTTNDLYHVRVVGGHDSAIEGAGRLQALTNGGIMWDLKEPLLVRFDTWIANFAIVGVGNITSSTLASGEQVAIAETVNNFAIALVPFVFLEADNVRVVELRASDLYAPGGSPATADTRVSVQIRGIV